VRGEFKITKHDLCCFLVKQELLQHFTALIPHKHYSRERAVKRKVGSRCKTTPRADFPHNHFLHHQRETLITSYNLQSNMPFNGCLILSLSLSLSLLHQSTREFFGVFQHTHTTLYYIGCCILNGDYLNLFTRAPWAPPVYQGTSV
jgi:hypothetical protein